VLQVRSTPEQGTILRLVLPCAVPEGKGVAAAPAPAPIQPRTAPDSRVLVVEDDPVNRQVIELFLKKFNLTPRVATDGESAVRLAATETFDLILMDCQLPGMDGLEATRQIRKKLSAGRPVRIVALTANTSREIRERCLAAGMDDFLSKPVRLESLAEVLQRNPVSSSA
jgi:CheY-like chemotaxis protein